MRRWRWWSEWARAIPDKSPAVIVNTTSRGAKIWRYDDDYDDFSVSVFSFSLFLGPESRLFMPAPVPETQLEGEFIFFFKCISTYITEIEHHKVCFLGSGVLTAENKYIGL